jgi:hypothetical protein
MRYVTVTRCDPRVIQLVLPLASLAPPAVVIDKAHCSPRKRADGVITVIATENKKREGSASYARYSLLRSCMTVAEYIAAAGQVRVDPAVV